VVAPDQQGHRGEDGCQDDQQAYGCDPVEGGLDGEPWALEHRSLDMEQGQAGNRAGEHAGAGDIGESGHHDQVDVLVLKSPAEAPQLAGVEAR